MECMLSNMPSSELAAFLLEKAKKECIIPELFDLFGFHRICSSVDPNLLDTLIHMFDDSDCQSEEILTQIIDLVRQEKRCGHATENVLLQQIDAYLDQHLGENLQMEQMAEALHISYHYLFHFFKQKTSLTPSAFLIRKRMEKAIHLLTETDDKIYDISFRCGFNSNSYFAALFKQKIGKTPSEFRRDHRNTHFLDFYQLEDMLLATKIDFLSILDKPVRALSPHCADAVCLSPLEDEFQTQHSSHIIRFQDTLFTCWCSLHGKKQDTSAIYCKRSKDGGKTWSERETIVSTVSGDLKLHSVQFCICGSGLYLFYNELLAPDTIQSLKLLRLNPETDRFEQVCIFPISFRPTSDLITLPNGKLLIAGHSGRLYKYPHIPVVMISDSGEIHGEWRQVPITTDNAMPNGSKLTQPAVSLILCDGILYAFCRNDMRRVPLVYRSHDFGETWSKAAAYDLPTTRNRICSGTLSDGQNYLIANTDRFDQRYAHSRLCVYFSRPNTMQFDRKLVLFDAEEYPDGNAITFRWPSAAECDGKLLVTASRIDRKNQYRDVYLFTVDLDQI